jgi:hypothetical protein
VEFFRFRAVMDAVGGSRGDMVRGLARLKRFAPWRTDGLHGRLDGLGRLPPLLGVIEGSVQNESESRSS